MRRAPEKFSCARAEVLDQNAGRGQREKRIEREARTERNHEGQRQSHQHGCVGRIHDRRAQQIAHRAQIVGSAGHNVAGAVALIVGVAEAFEAREQIVAQIEFNVARNADHDPASEELEDAFAEGDGEQ